MTLNLQGKTIISTRPTLESDRIKSLLQEKGACVIDFPLIRTECVSLSEKLKTLLRTINSFQWIVFTSKNGVLCFVELLKQAGIAPESVASKKFAVIGKATAETLEEQIGSPAFIAGGRNSTDLLTEFQPQLSPQDKVLLALAELSDSTLENGLKAFCAVTRVDVYHTLDIDYESHPALDRIVARDYDLILFTSPSGFRNFHRISSHLSIDSLKAASIGTTTAAEMCRLGTSPLLISSRSDAESFVNEIQNFFKTTPSE